MYGFIGCDCVLVSGKSDGKISYMHVHIAVLYIIFPHTSKFKFCVFFLQAREDLSSPISLLSANLSLRVGGLLLLLL